MHSSTSRRHRRNWQRYVFVNLGVAIFTIFFIYKTSELNKNEWFYTKLRLSSRSATACTTGTAATTTDTTELPIGIEMEYLFPNTRVDTLDDDESSLGHLNAVQTALSRANLSSVVLVDDEEDETTAKKWQIYREHNGFELVSPVLSRMCSWQPILGFVMDAMARHGVGTHVLHTNFHASIDATGRSLSQIRDVYKNTMAVEKALDVIRDCPKRADHSFKSLSVRQQFDSLQHGYQALDACFLRDDWECMVEKTAEAVRYKLGQTEYYHIINVRFGWEEINVVVEDDEAKKNETKKNETTTQQQPNEWLYDGWRGWPVRIEFRGQRAQTDGKFVVAWVQLLHNLVQASYDGIVLDPVERTADQEWKAMFDELIRNDDLRHYLEEHRRQGGGEEGRTT